MIRKESDLRLPPCCSGAHKEVLWEDPEATLLPRTKDGFQRSWIPCVGKLHSCAKLRCHVLSTESFEVLSPLLGKVCRRSKDKCSIPPSPGQVMRDDSKGDVGLPHPDFISQNDSGLRVKTRENFPERSSLTPGIFLAHSALGIEVDQLLHMRRPQA